MTDPLSTPPSGSHEPPRGRRRHGSQVSRHLLLGWLIWLLISVTVNLAIDTPRSDWNNHTLRPAVRGLLQSIMIGLGVVWPLWRLTMARPDNPGRRVASDATTLLALTQIPLAGAMVWAGWPPGHLLVIDLIVVVWTMAAAVCLWAGWRAGTTLARGAAMAGCCVLMLGGWLAVGAGAPPDTARWSSLYLLWTLSDPLAEIDRAETAWRLIVVFLASAAAWSFGLAVSRSSSRTVLL